MTISFFTVISSLPGSYVSPCLKVTLIYYTTKCFCLIRFGENLIPVWIRFVLHVQCVFMIGLQKTLVKNRKKSWFWYNVEKVNTPVSFWLVHYSTKN